MSKLNLKVVQDRAQKVLAQDAYFGGSQEPELANDVLALIGEIERLRGLPVGQKRFAVSVAAWRLKPDGTLETHSVAELLKVATREEAIGREYVWAHKEYPSADGWQFCVSCADGEDAP